jgi:hypothetical protein
MLEKIKNTAISSAQRREYAQQRRGDAEKNKAHFGEALIFSLRLRVSAARATVPLR